MQGVLIHIFTLFLSLGFGLGIFLQPNFCLSQTDGNFGAALLLGGTATQVDGDDFAGYDKLGIHGGVRSFYRLPKNFSVSLDLTYSQKGSFRKAVSTVSGPQPSIRLKFNYVEIPVMLNYLDRDLLSIAAGLSFNRLISARHFNDDLEQDDPVESFDMRNWDMEAVVVGGFRFGEHFGLELKYGYSLFYIGQVSVSNFKNRGMYNNSLTLRLSYQL